MNSYDYGNLVRVRFCFPNRVLTDAEKATYLAGGNLPAGVGFDPDTVLFDYTPPGVAKSTDTYPANMVKESTGQYYRDIDSTLATTGGTWVWRGYSPGVAAIKGRFFVENP